MVMHSYVNLPLSEAIQILRIALESDTEWLDSEQGQAASKQERAVMTGHRDGLSDALALLRAVTP